MIHHEFILKPKKHNIMKKPYFSLLLLKRSDFASDFLFETAKEAEDKFLKEFESLINETESPHSKHCCKMLEAAFRANKSVDLIIAFNKEKAESAALKELFIEMTTVQNQLMTKLCFEAKKFFKSKSHSEKGEAFEKSMLASMGVLVEIFFNNISDPEKFHEQKRSWLNDFNQAKQSKKLRAVHV
jgi:hypothetical protein